MKDRSAEKRSDPRALVKLALLCALACAARPALAGDGHSDPEVLRAREARLPRGVLPAWETEREKREHPRSAAIPHAARIDERLLPPPPDPGYRAPAEFEPVAAYLVSQGDWSEWGMNPSIEMLYDLILKGTAGGGAGAIVLSSDPAEDCEAQLQDQGVDLERVRVLRPPAGLDAKWARDFGPIGIYEDGVDGRLGLVDLHYYDHRFRDDAVVEFLADEIGLSRYGLEGADQSPADSHRLYMEGGNYQSDGRGTCILSNDIPDDNDGNPDADTFEEVEALLASYLGCEQVIWLTPPPNTGTGHVDMYAKLLTPTDILVIDLPDQSGNNGEADAIIEDDVEVLESATNLSDESFTVHRVTIPSLNGGLWDWVYKTYTNSVMLNDLVLVPTYGESPYDADAIAVYEEVLGPDYDIVGVPSGSIVAQGGAVHCTTMQIPSACGNGVRDELLFEECDGEDLAGRTCESLGEPIGELACDGECRFDLSGCGGGGDADADADTDADTDIDTDPDGGGDGGIDLGSPGSSGCGCSEIGPSSTASLCSLFSILI